MQLHMTMTLLSFSSLVFLFIYTCSGQQYNRVCYFTNWAQYRWGPGKYTPEDIPTHLCSHIIYAFASMEGNKLKAFEWNDDSTDWMKGQYAKVISLKEKSPGLKILLGVGGWNFGTERMTAMLKTQGNRAEFVKTSIEFLRKRTFDGLDLDFEYPAGRGSPPEDKQRFASLVQELWQGFEQESRTSGKPRLLLTAAVAAGKSKIDAGYDIPMLGRLFDMINLMSYDFHGKWEDKTGHNCPLYGHKGETGDQKYLNLAYAAEYWVKQGAPARKINVGLPLYGRTFTLKDKTVTGVGAPAKKGGTPGKYTQEEGYLSYYEVCAFIKSGAKVFWLEEQQVPYAVKDDQWVGFDDQISLKKKVEWIKARGFGGVMTWALDLDDFNGQCGGENNPLLSTISKELGTLAPSVSQQVQPPASNNIIQGVSYKWDPFSNKVDSIPAKVSEARGTQLSNAKPYFRPLGQTNIHTPFVHQKSISPAPQAPLPAPVQSHITKPIIRDTRNIPKRKVSLVSQFSYTPDLMNPPYSNIPAPFGSQFPSNEYKIMPYRSIGDISVPWKEQDMDNKPHGSMVLSDDLFLQAFKEFLDGLDIGSNLDTPGSNIDKYHSKSDKGYFQQEYSNSLPQTSDWKQNNSPYQMSLNMPPFEINYFEEPQHRTKRDYNSQSYFMNMLAKEAEDDSTHPEEIISKEEYEEGNQCSINGGTFQLLGDCGRYKVCMDGHLDIKDCPQNTFFAKSLGVCTTHIEMSNCPTSPPFNNTELDIQDEPNITEEDPEKLSEKDNTDQNDLVTVEVVSSSDEAVDDRVFETGIPGDVAQIYTSTEDEGVKSREDYSSETDYPDYIDYDAHASTPDYTNIAQTEIFSTDIFNPRDRRPTVFPDVATVGKLLPKSPMPIRSPDMYSVRPTSQLQDEYQTTGTPTTASDIYTLKTGPLGQQINPYATFDYLPSTVQDQNEYVPDVNQFAYPPVPNIPLTDKMGPAFQRTVVPTLPSNGMGSGFQGTVSPTIPKSPMQFQNTPTYHSTAPSSTYTYATFPTQPSILSSTNGIVNLENTRSVRSTTNPSYESTTDPSNFELDSREGIDDYSRLDYPTDETSNSDDISTTVESVVEELKINPTSDAKRDKPIVFTYTPSTEIVMDSIEQTYTTTADRSSDIESTEGVGENYYDYVYSDDIEEDKRIGAQYDDNSDKSSTAKSSTEGNGIEDNTEMDVSEGPGNEKIYDTRFRKEFAEMKKRIKDLKATGGPNSDGAKLLEHKIRKQSLADNTSNVPSEIGNNRENEIVGPVGSHEAIPDINEKTSFSRELPNRRTVPRGDFRRQRLQPRRRLQPQLVRRNMIAPNSRAHQGATSPQLTQLLLDPPPSISPPREEGTLSDDELTLALTELLTQLEEDARAKNGPPVSTNIRQIAGARPQHSQRIPGNPGYGSSFSSSSGIQRLPIRPREILTQQQPIQRSAGRPISNTNGPIRRRIYVNRDRGLPSSRSTSNGDRSSPRLLQSSQVELRRSRRPEGSQQPVRSSRLSTSSEESHLRRRLTQRQGGVIFLNRPPGTIDNNQEPSGRPRRQSSESQTPRRRVFRNRDSIPSPRRPPQFRPSQKSDTRQLSIEELRHQRLQSQVRQQAHLVPTAPQPAAVQTRRPLPLPQPSSRHNLRAPPSYQPSRDFRQSPSNTIYAKPTQRHASPLVRPAGVLPPMVPDAQGRVPVRIVGRTPPQQYGAQNSEHPSQTYHPQSNLNYQNRQSAPPRYFP